LHEDVDFVWWYMDELEGKMMPVLPGKVPLIEGMGDIGVKE
jgi:hypothetical protein